MKVKICGIPYDIERVPVIDEDLEGITQGKILYSQSKILIKDGLTTELEESVIFHEVLHGILMLLGYTEYSADEQFVQAVSNAMWQMFDLRFEEGGK